MKKPSDDFRIWHTDAGFWLATMKINDKFWITTNTFLDVNAAFRSFPEIMFIDASEKVPIVERISDEREIETTLIEFIPNTTLN